MDLISEALFDAYGDSSASEKLSVDSIAKPMRLQEQPRRSREACAKF